jgi:hypothetical protein
MSDDPGGGSGGGGDGRQPLTARAREPGRLPMSVGGSYLDGEMQPRDLVHALSQLRFARRDSLNTIKIDRDARDYILQSIRARSKAA